MLTKQDFLDQIQNSVAQYPAVSALYRAGDPRILQAQSAMAQMLAMISQQLEIGMMEPFSKVRDATVLADAALKGLVPMAIPSRITVKVQNTSSSPFVLQSGRKLFDSSGNSYDVDLPLTVEAGAFGYAQLVQAQSRSVQYAVVSTSEFKKFLIEAPEDGRKICGIKMVDATGFEYRYAREFVNVMPDEKVYNIEVDEYQRTYIVLGYKDVVGYQPSAGEIFTVTVNETAGAVQLAQGSPFAFQYSTSAQDAKIKITMDSVLIAGADPIDIPTLRELCKYPSVYDSNAVFLGEFDFLIRRNVPNLRFLSVWNESVEESIRGANVNNINRIFVSFVEPSGSDHAATQEIIRQLINNADDSYRISFVTAVVVNIQVVVNASVARVNDVDVVKNKIEESILGEYGIDSPAVRVGMSTPQYKRLYEKLKSEVTALQDNGSDFTLVIASPVGQQLPEQFRYMTAQSVTVNVTQANYNLNGWGH